MREARRAGRMRRSARRARTDRSSPTPVDDRPFRAFGYRARITQEGRTFVVLLAISHCDLPDDCLTGVVGMADRHDRFVAFENHGRGGRCRLSMAPAWRVSKGLACSHPP